MSIVKVSVKNVSGTDNALYEIDLSKTLEANIQDICKFFETPYSTTIYGLKVVTANDGKSLETYVSPDNFKQIKDGYFLQLVLSLDYYIKRIFDHISDDFKERSFHDLHQLSVDPEFIKELVKTEKHLDLIKIFTNNKLTDAEDTACLIALVHLFQKLYITEIDQAFLEKIITICKSRRNGELIKYSLSVLHKILVHRDHNFLAWKEEILKSMTVTELIQLISKKNLADLQFCAFLVINAMIKCCKGDKRKQFIKEISLKQHREYIHQHVIAVGNVSNGMAHELYIYQTYLLSEYAEPLNSVITINDSDLFERDEFQLNDCDVKKLTMLMDFDESMTKNKSTSTENMIDVGDIRISLASMSSKYSDDSRLSNRLLSTATNESVELDNYKISVLTIEALRYYKRHHYKNFYQSQVEEQFYEPGILVSGERIVRLLANLLHIGSEPDRTTLYYQPPVFTCSTKSPFFFELFSRTMWLLSKTRREMKASTLQDYEKVLKILAKQVRLVLTMKSADYKSLMENLIEVNYEKVVEKWQKEKQAEFKVMLATNPSVQTIKEDFVTKNKKVIYEQRMNYIHNGTRFPKFTEKKITGNFLARLASNQRELMICDVNAITKVTGETTTYSLMNITHIVEGKACPHVMNQSVKEPNLAFSIVVDNDKWINFKAADHKMASYWLDALNLLLDKEGRSQYYKLELMELVEMDLYLHFLELQNVQVPKKPPPVPKLPFDIRPIIPPKPKIVQRQTPN